MVFASLTGRERPGWRERPRLAVSVGCPAGIGPEVSVAAACSLADSGEPVDVVLVADPGVLRRAAEHVGVPWSRFAELSDPRARIEPGALAYAGGSARMARLPTMGTPSAEAGDAQLAWIDQAADLARSGATDALVTGPASKLAVSLGSSPEARAFRGHTEHLAARLGAPHVVMAFAGDELVTALVTTHLALREVPNAITSEGVCQATVHLAELLLALGRSPARLAVASLNPHAGEGGLFGGEEASAIGPGIELARRALRGAPVRIEGPVGAETALRRARGRSESERAFDGVVCMYHDQATIPMKLLSFGEAVNVTLGLPIVRTSVDHGTGYDVAGRGLARPEGMLEALRLAAKLALARGPAGE
jgi:4-hydroxythreonine-4-phosphate dehydrogenase